MNLVQLCQRTAILMIVFVLSSLSHWLPVVAQSTAATAGPDLIVKSITVNPPNPGNGDVADIAIVIRNIGDAPANGFYTYLYVDPTAMPPVAETVYVTPFYYGIDLLPNTEATFTRTEHAFTADKPLIAAYVDPPWENRVQESNEANNLATLPSQPPPPPTPDAYEPDNSCGGAKAITTDGTQQVRNLYRKNNEPDLDLVTFEATAGVRPTISKRLPPVRIQILSWASRSIVSTRRRWVVGPRSPSPPPETAPITLQSATTKNHTAQTTATAFRSPPIWAVWKPIRATTAVRTRAICRPMRPNNMPFVSRAGLIGSNFQ